MKNRPTATVDAKLAQARQLMTLGHRREALALALDALITSLHNLRDSFTAMHLQLCEVHREPDTLRRHPDEPFSLLGEKKGRFLH
jgi:hypothetical protein